MDWGSFDGSWVKDKSMSSEAFWSTWDSCADPAMRLARTLLVLEAPWFIDLFIALVLEEIFWAIVSLTGATL